MKVELEFENRQQIENLYWALSTCWHQLSDEQKKDAYIVELLSESTSPSRKDILRVRAKQLDELNNKIESIDHLMNQLNTQIRYKKPNKSIILLKRRNKNGSTI